MNPRNPPFSEADYLDIAIGALIETRRKRKKLTQEKLVAKTGLSQSRISRIETGASVTLAEFRALERVLGPKLEAEAKLVVGIARHGSGAMLSDFRGRMHIETQDLIPLVAARWK